MSKFSSVKFNRKLLLASRHYHTHADKWLKRLEEDTLYELEGWTDPHWDELVVILHNLSTLVIVGSIDKSTGE